MYTACKYDTSAQRIRIDFTRSGRRAFHRLNAKLGKAYIRFITLERDLAEYIERHMDGGDPMISEFSVRYDGGVFLTVYCSGGIFYITDAYDIGTVIATEAVLVWVRVKRGCNYLLRQVLACWRNITAPQAASC